MLKINVNSAKEIGSDFNAIVNEIVKEYKEHPSNASSIYVSDRRYIIGKCSTDDHKKCFTLWLEHGDCANRKWEEIKVVEGSDKRMPNVERSIVRLVSAIIRNEAKLANEANKSLTVVEETVKENNETVEDNKETVVGETVKENNETVVVETVKENNNNKINNDMKQTNKIENSEINNGAEISNPRLDNSVENDSPMLNLRYHADDYIRKIEEDIKESRTRGTAIDIYPLDLDIMVYHENDVLVTALRDCKRKINLVEVNGSANRIANVKDSAVMIYNEIVKYAENIINNVDNEIEKVNAMVEPIISDSYNRLKTNEYFIYTYSYNYILKNALSLFKFINGKEIYKCDEKINEIKKAIEKDSLIELSKKIDIQFDGIINYGEKIDKRTFDAIMYVYDAKLTKNGKTICKVMRWYENDLEFMLNETVYADRCGSDFSIKKEFGSEEEALEWFNDNLDNVIDSYEDIISNYKKINKDFDNLKNNNDMKIKEKFIAKLDESIDDEAREDFKDLAEKLTHPNSFLGDEYNKNDTDVSVQLKDNDWYDNIPFFYTYDSPEGSVIELSNSEDCFDSIVTLESHYSKLDIFNGLCELANEYAEYVKDIDNETKQEIIDSDSCYDEGTWVA